MKVEKQKEMKNKFLIKTAVSVAGLVAAGMVPAYAQMTLELNDGHGHTLTLSDSATPGEIVYFGGLAGSIWTADIDVALTKPIIGGQFQPEVDLSIQSATSTAAGALTITVISSGFGPLASASGMAVLSAGGAGANGSLAASGQVNGSTVVGPVTFTTNPWSGDSSGNIASGLSSTFSIGETVVITHNTAGAGKQGDVSLSVPVPEPTSMVAGALLLLPFGASTLRFVRKNRAA